MVEREHMKKGLLSIIVPVYNGEKYIRETLDSLKASVYQNIEIVIIDDGSLDCSRMICEEYADADQRFRIICQENRGIVGARNRGLSEAHGEYVGFCDQDDIVNKMYYSKAIEKMEQDGSEICICSSMKFFEMGDQRTRICEKQVDALYEGAEIGKKIVMPTVLANYIINFNDEIAARGTIWNCIIRKDIIDRHNLKFQKNVHFEDDWLLRIDVLLRAGKVSTIALCGYYWRTNLQSESNRKVYIDHFEQKQAATRNYVARQLQENGLQALTPKYISYQKCFDMVKILENEGMVHRSYRDRKQYLYSVLGELNTPEARAGAKDIKKGEIRYRLLLFFIRKGHYLMAFYCNCFLIEIRTLLYRFRLAYFVENIVNGVR